MTSRRSTRPHVVGELAPRATRCVEQGYWGWISAEVTADGAREIKQDLHYY
jgi:hypothetical protein